MGQWEQRENFNVSQSTLIVHGGAHRGALVYVSKGTEMSIAAGPKAFTTGGYLHESSLFWDVVTRNPRLTHRI